MLMSVSDLGFPEILKSITNPNVRNVDAIDSIDPMSFLTFIKMVSVSFQPDTLQRYYIEYLSRWNNKKGRVDSDNRTIIVERYREFIKDISINYTTIEERKFLSKLDFNDPSDLDIAIPFFSKKLIEISKYYNEKREDSKFEIFRIKTRGSNFGVKREILELTLGYLSDIQDRDLKFDYDSIKNKIEVEIEELYDYEPSYFNQDPNISIYDNKDLDYGLDVFLMDDQDLISEIFNDLSDDAKILKEVNTLFDHKRNLTTKYISTDFFFLSTGDTVTNFISGKAFEADDPISNFLNRDYPTTASTESNNLKNSSDVGFFKPQKTSIVLIDGGRNSFKINFQNLEANKIYYFPDPSIIGKNGDIITFVVNDSLLKMNGSSGIAKNLPSSKETDSKFYGYNSIVELGENKYLDTVFESGYIQDSKYDIFGNLYGLFKNDNNFRQSITTRIERVVKSLPLNGHMFYDDIYDEGFIFDYGVEDYDTFDDIKRSGITTNTSGFSALSGFYTLFGRFFSPYQELIYEKNISYEFYDGGFLMDGDLPYPEPNSSDLSAFPIDEPYYYDILIEGGINDSTTMQRALLDVSYPSLTANMLENFRPNEIDTFSIDCKTLTTPFIWDNTNTGLYIDDTFETTQYNISSFDTDNFYQRLESNGNIFIRNHVTKKVDSITNTFSYISGGVSSNIFTELLSSINSFDLVNDTMFVDTTNYLVVFKIQFDGERFINPKGGIYTFNKNSNPFNHITNRYKIKGDVFFSVTNPDTNPLNTKEFKLYLYKLNLEDFKLYKFDYSISFLEASTTSVKMDTPSFSYNSIPNIMSITFVTKDENDVFEINEMDFDAKNYSIMRHNRFTT